MSRVPLPLILGLALAAAGLSPTQADASDLAVVVEAGARSLSNSADTEKAIFDSTFGIGAGVGLSYDRGPKWRFGVDARRVEREGERAFAADRTSPAYRLGHPLTLTMIESVASVSYRFAKLGPVSPYVALGGGAVFWKERSDIAGLVEDARGTSALFEGRIGVERAQGPLRLGIEGGITFMPSAIGAGGISQVYGETDLGGFFVVGKVAFSRR